MAEAIFAVYAEMDDKRSLVRLHKLLVEKAIYGEPSLRTIQNLSAKHNWHARIEAHDAQVTAQTNTKLVEKMANERFDKITSLENVVKKALTIAEGMLTTGAGRDPLHVAVKLTGSVAELTELVKVALEASKHHQLLVGGVTGREEIVRRDMLPHVSDEELVTNFARYTRRAAAPGADDAPGADRRPKAHIH